MIKKISSKQLMDTLDNAQKSISEVKDNINMLDLNLTNKLKVLSSIQEFTTKQILEIKETNGSINANKILFTKPENIVAGNYNQYGLVIHPSLIKNPNQIFNFSSSSGYIFKNNMNVRINNIIKEDYKNMLMHDSISDKGITYEEFESNEIMLEIEINPKDLLGATSFNTIELLPYLPGSFNITQIKVFTMQDYHNKETVIPALNLVTDIEDFGASRILLPKSYDMYKCQIYIDLKFKNSAGKYPFGLKHLYFLKCNYNFDSYIIAKITKKDYIDSISEKIFIHSQNGIYETSCKEEGIELYMSYAGNVLSLELETSTDLITNPISQNIKEFYMKIPITCSMVSLEFDKIITR